MLEKMQSKGNSNTLLVGVYVSKTTLKHHLVSSATGGPVHT